MSVKKLRFSFCVLLCCVTLNLFAQPHHYFDVFVPQFKGGFKFCLGSFYLRAITPHSDYAITLEGGDYDFNGLNPNFDGFSYELGIGYDFPGTGNDVIVDFSQLVAGEDEIKLRGTGSLASAFTRETAIPYLTDTVTSVTGGIGLAIAPLMNADQFDFIQASTRSEGKTLDFELSQNLLVTPDLRLRILGGLRGVKLNNTFNSALGVDRTGDQQIVLIGLFNTVGLPATPFLETVNLTDVDFTYRHDLAYNSQFNGVGPRFGLVANYNLGIGFSLFGCCATSLLAGNSHSTSCENISSAFSGTVTSVSIDDPDLIPGFVPGEQLQQYYQQERANTKPNSIRIVPNMEARLGISYAACLPCSDNRFFIEGGYMVDHYWQAIDRTFLTDLAQPSHPRAEVLNQTFEGFYIKLAMHL